MKNKQLNLTSGPILSTLTELGTAYYGIFFSGYSLQYH